MSEGGLEELRRLPIQDVAERLGLSTGRMAAGPCPCCGAVRRGRQDRRLPIGIQRSGQGWVCNACQRSGNGIEMVSWVLFSKSARELGWEEWRQIREWATRGAYGNRIETRDIKNIPIPAAPAWPPIREVRETWARLRPLSSAPLPEGGAQEEEAWRWLQLRRIDVGMVGALDLARVQVAGAALPAWVPGWPWGLALPLADSTGLVRSLRWRAPRGAKVCGENLLDRLRREAGGDGAGGEQARALLADPVALRVLGEAPRPKSRTPAGFEAAGLVLADPMGRALLGRVADGRVAMRAQDGAETEWDGRVLLVEGDADWLIWAAHPKRVRGGQSYAAIGYTSGAWGRAHADRLPSGCMVIIRHHGDQAGIAYEHRIRDTLPTGIRLRVLQAD